MTREDIQSQNPSGIRAIETYGECPKPILLKSKRAKISPAIREKPKAVEITIKKKETVEKTTSVTSEGKTELEKEEAGADSLFGMG